VFAAPALARDEQPTPTANDVAPAATKDGYIVVPFENHSPVKQLDWQSSALAVTIAEKLETHPLLRPAYGPAVLDGIGYAFDPEKVARRAVDGGAKWVFAGGFSRPNWKAEVSIKLYTVVAPSNDVPIPTLRLVAESSSVGEREQLMKLVDDNLLAVLAKQQWTPDGEALAQVKRRPTKDLYAFTLYGRAMNEFFGFGVPRDAKKAITLLKKVNLIDPKMAEAHRMLGVVYLDEGDKPRAQGQYSYALDLKPGYYQALAGLARLYRAEGNRVRAQEMVEKALDARPWDIEMREMLGELLWENADLDHALAELEKVVAVAPRHLQARRTLALIYAARGDTTDLAQELERVSEIAPEDLEVKLDLGSAYQRMGDTDKAIRAYEEVLTKEPKNVQALKFVGDCYRRAKETDKAIAAYQRVMKLSPTDPRPYFLLGAVYEEAGNDGKAEQVFQDAQQFKRYLGEAWTNLGAIAFRRGDLSKATWYLSRAVVKAPTRPKGHYNYALLLSAKKERDKALDELKIAGDLDPADAEIRYLAGVILLRQGRLDEAKAMFGEALKRNPDHADARHNLALLEDLERRYGGEQAASGSR
jgi:tetratricopeptide (TPR) repeat protein